MLIKRTVPDGGWGWVVVFGALGIHSITDGIILTTAILYKSWIDHYKSSVFVTTLVVSLMSGAALFTGPIAASFIAVFGCRKVGLFGSIISTVGLTLTAYSPSIYFLLFSFGILTGCGFGFLYIASIVAVTEYFEKRLAFAAGLAVSGSSIGIILFAPLIENLNSHFKWQMTIVVLSAISLLNILFSMTFIPIKSSVRSSEDISESFAKRSSPEEVGKQKQIIADTQTETNRSDVKNKTESEQLHTCNDHKELKEPSGYETFKDSLKTMFGTKLLFETRFTILAIFTFISSLGFMVPQIFLKVRALQLDGVKEEKDTHGLLTLIGVGSTVGRVFFGYIADYKWCRRFIVFIVAHLICGAVSAASIYLNTYTSFAFYCVVFGMSSGTFVMLSSVVATDCFGIKMAANSFGLLSFFDGIALLIGPPFIGLFESKGNKVEFVIAGATMIVGGLGFSLIPIYDRVRSKCTRNISKEENRQTSVTDTEANNHDDKINSVN